MSKTAGDPPADPKNDPPKSDPPKAEPPKSDPPKSDPPADPKTPKPEKTFTKAELEAASNKAVEDAKKKWDEEKDLSELERVKKENQELRDGNRLRDAKEKVVAALSAAGSKSPELTFQAIKSDLKFDDKGELLNTKDLIDGLKTTYPDQFGVAKPTEGIDGGAGGEGTNATKLTQAQLAKMTPQEVAALPWDEVKAVMAAKE